MNRVKVIRNHLNSAIEPVELDIIDDSHLHAGHAGAASGGGHFSVKIISKKFTGLPTLARHRLVYQAVEDLMPAEIHALSITATTPEEHKL